MAIFFKKVLINFSLEYYKNQSDSLHEEYYNNHQIFTEYLDHDEVYINNDALEMNSDLKTKKKKLALNYNNSG